MALVRSIAGSLVVAGTVYLTWLQLHPQTDSVYAFWEAVSIGVIAAVGIVTAFSQPISYWYNGHLDAARDKVCEALRGLNVGVADTAGVDFKQLGASAWAVRGVGPFEHLYRLGRERFAAEPQPSRIRWTRGKGIIGECWAKEQTLVVNVGRFDDEHRNGLTNEVEWAALTDENRRGMKLADYDKIRGKYGTVIAVPIRDAGDDHRVVGVLTLDAPKGIHRKLNKPEVTEMVSNAARVVAKYIT